MTAAADGTVTLAMILGEAAARGLRLYLGEDGRPHLAGPKGMITPTLLDALKYRREQVIRHLGGNPAPSPASPPAEAMRQWRSREWLKIDGTVVVDDPASPREWPPQGCYWQREQGGPWAALAGRLPVCRQLPANDPYGCWEASQGRRCAGCKEAADVVA
jgi:hypothetical protein